METNFKLKYFTEVEIEKVSPEEKEKRRRRALVYDIKDIIKKGDTLTDEELEYEINDALRLYFVNSDDTFWLRRLFLLHFFKK